MTAGYEALHGTLSRLINFEGTAAQFDNEALFDEDRIAKSNQRNHGYNPYGQNRGMFGGFGGFQAAPAQPSFGGGFGKRPMKAGNMRPGFNQPENESKSTVAGAAGGLTEAELCTKLMTE